MWCSYMKIILLNKTCNYRRLVFATELIFSNIQYYKIELKWVQFLYGFYMLIVKAVVCNSFLDIFAKIVML